MGPYQIVGFSLLLLPIVIGLIGFLSRWSRLAPQPVESHARVWGRRCPRCQSEDFASTGDGHQKCSRCGNVFI